MTMIRWTSGSVIGVVVLVAAMAASMSNRLAFALAPPHYHGSQLPPPSTAKLSRAPVSGSTTSHVDTATSRRRRDLVVALSGAATTAAATVFSLSPPSVVYAKDLKEEYRQGTAALAENDSMAPVPREAYQKLASGVVYADLRPGSGMDVVKSGSRVNLQWVLRKSNGYFVDSSQVNDSVPFIFTVNDGTAIAGLNEAVQGMKVGGVRRILIPPSLAYVDGLEDGKPGPLPMGFGPRQQMRRVQNVRKDVPGEYVYLEIQLTRLRQ